MSDPQRRPLANHRAGAPADARSYARPGTRRETRGGGGLFTFLVGIAAGAAAGYYLSTEEGRRVRQRLQDRSSNFARDAQTYARDSSSKASGGLHDAVEKGNRLINDLSAEVKAKANAFGTDARAKADEVSANVKATVDQVAANAKVRVDELSGEVKTRVEEYRRAAQDSASRSQSAFQEGVERGKAKLNQQKAEIDNLVKDGKDPKPTDKKA